MSDFKGALETYLWNDLEERKYLRGEMYTILRN